MQNIANVNLKVLLFDSDYYALQALNSYLAWDRRTRVTYMTQTQNDLWAYMADLPAAEMPDVIVLDADHVGEPDALGRLMTDLRRAIPDVQIICLAQRVDNQRVEAAISGGARAYFLKGEVRLQIAWAIVYSLSYDFVVTAAVARVADDVFFRTDTQPKTLPERREYPEMTERIRQAIQLCVVEGMPAHLAADEMGISLHTIRGYVKEGYRILESYDDTQYPVDMTPQERAFMRFTALDLENDDSENGNDA